MHSCHTQINSVVGRGSTLYSWFSYGWRMNFSWMIWTLVRLITTHILNIANTIVLRCILLNMCTSKWNIVRIIIHFVHFQFKSFSFKFGVCSLNFNDLIFIFLYLIFEKGKFALDFLFSQVGFVHLVFEDIHLFFVIFSFSLSIFNLMF